MFDTIKLHERTRDQYILRPLRFSIKYTFSISNFIKIAEIIFEQLKNKQTIFLFFNKIEFSLFA